jgi:hypothetical protein
LLACFSQVVSTDLANFSWTERLLSMNSPSRNTGKETGLNLSLLLASHFFRRLSPSAFNDGNMNLIIGAKWLRDVRSWVVFSALLSSIHLWQSTLGSMFPRGISLSREIIPFKIWSVCSVLVLFVLTLPHKMATQPHTVYSLHSF